MAGRYNSKKWKITKKRNKSTHTLETRTRIERERQMYLDSANIRNIKMDG
jgi:hypothetical protein